MPGTVSTSPLSGTEDDQAKQKSPEHRSGLFLGHGLPAAVIVPVIVPARVVGRPAVIGVARRVIGRTVVIVAVRPPVIRIRARSRRARNQCARGKTDA